MHFGILGGIQGQSLSETQKTAPVMSNNTNLMLMIRIEIMYIQYKYMIEDIR